MPKAKMTKGAVRNKVYAKTEKDWQDWLQQYHQTANEIWLIFYRPHTERQTINYEDALKIAAKFGWKHTLIKRIDDDSYARKFIRDTQKPEKEIEKPAPEDDSVKETVPFNIIEETENPELAAEPDIDLPAAEEFEIEDEMPIIPEFPEDEETGDIAEEEEEEEPEKYLTFENEFGEEDDEIFPPEDHIAGEDWEDEIDLPVSSLEQDLLSEAEDEDDEFIASEIEEDAAGVPDEEVDPESEPENAKP